MPTLLAALPPFAAAKAFVGWLLAASTGLHEGAATGADPVGATVIVIAPTGVGTVTVTVTGVEAHPCLQTVVVVSKPAGTPFEP